MMYMRADERAVRTQIYLTPEQREGLNARARSEGKTMAQVIRDAVDRHLDEDLKAILDRTFGMYPDFEVPPRSEWNREF